MQDKTTELLEQILNEIRSQNFKTELGFGYSPKPIYIYANRSNPPHIWYMWDHKNDAPIAIEQTALTGIFESLAIEEKEFRGKPDPKVNLTIRADRPYIVQAGLDTLFAKGLLYTLAKMPSEAFRQPVTIAVEPGETEQVLFCRIYNPASGNSVYCPYPDEVDWSAVTQRAIAKIEQAHRPAPSGQAMGSGAAVSGEVIASLIWGRGNATTADYAGQHQLLPTDDRAPADAINQSIAEATTKEELEKIGRSIEGMWDALGPMASALMDKVNRKIIALDKAENGSVAQEMERVGWDTAVGKQFLMDNFGKQRRAELTPEEMTAFIAHLRNLPDKQLEQGEWE